MAAGLLVAVAAVQVGANAELLAKEVHSAAAYDQLLELVHVPAGKYLRERVPPEEWLVVVLDAGAIPYYSKLKTIDFGGLNDEFLSKRRHRKIPKSEQADYLFSVNPGVVVFTSKRPDRIDKKRARRFANLLEDARFERYELVARFSPSSHKYYELVYLRRDLVPRSQFASLKRKADWPGPNALVAEWTSGLYYGRSIQEIAEPHGADKIGTPGIIVIDVANNDVRHGERFQEYGTAFARTILEWVSGSLCDAVREHSARRPTQRHPGARRRHGSR